MTSPLDGLGDGIGDAQSPGSAANTEPRRRVSNPPGRSTLDYRVDTRAGFLARMLERLATETLPAGPRAGTRPLAGLEVRDQADPAVALLDAWAVVADILTFYQERIANEGYLRTAAERRSVLELARLVGQELGPGVAASAFLAFTADDTPGSPLSVLVPRGTQVQSIPGQNELPQTFETEEDLVARAALNAMALRRGRPQTLAGAGELFLAGIDLRLTPGDPLLLVATTPTMGPGAVRTWVGRVAAVAMDAERQVTRAALESPVGFSADGLEGAAVEIFVLRQRAAFFGHNASRWGSLPASDVVRGDPYAGEESDWDQGRTIWTDSRGVAYSPGTDAAAPAIFLDREVTDVITGSWAVILGQELEGTAQLAAAYRVTSRAEGSRADYALTGPATSLGLALPQRSPLGGDVAPGPLAERPAFDLRRATAWLVSERLAPADRPIEAPYPDPAEDGSLAALELEGAVTGLRAGRPVIVGGELTSGGAVARVALLQRVDDSDPAHTRLFFQQPLLPVADNPAVRFVRATVRVRGNVVLATHGESGAEVLGSGDSDRSGQRFVLSRPPLTHVSAPVPGGRASTLRVRVDNALWQEVENLATEGPESPSYSVEIGDDGRAAVRFGNGRHGARLPTGRENVTAAYRSGLGLSGLVGADSLQLLITRPLGIREVTNPVAASGAAPPDRLEQARSNAAVAARTLGRIVSFSDFEDFARSFAGITKVKAVPIAGVHLTVAGEGGAAVEPGSALYQNLFAALEGARLPGPPLSLASYQPLPFRVGAQLVVDPRYRTEDVLIQAEAALLDAFSFDRRELEAPLYASDVLRVLQAVAGVVAVDLDSLYRADSPAAPAALAPILTAQPARFAGGRVLPAQLLLLQAGGAVLRGRTA